MTTTTPSILDDYRRFVDAKTQLGGDHGFEPLWMPDRLFPFQRALVTWALRKGSAAIFAGTGLGKTAMQLTFAENVVRHTGRPFLILAPIAVGPQTIAEGVKFGITCHHSRDGSFPPDARIVVTNYEKLHLFDYRDFSGACGDESSCIKAFDGTRRAEVTEFFRLLPYRLLCTATPAPNDYVELGTSAEALGQLGYRDMITMFFKQEIKKDYLGWGRAKYTLRGHAVKDFWRWVCSWARVVRKPSDLGFDDTGYDLPGLEFREHFVRPRSLPGGRLFEMPAETLPEQQDERRRTIPERCAKVAELVAAESGLSLVWCHLNPEGDELERLIPGSVQVAGADSDEWKERAVAWFTGQICLCGDRGKMTKCGSKSTRKTGGKNAKPTRNTSNGSPIVDPGLPRKTRSTCGPTISPISRNSSGLPSSRPQSMPAGRNGTPPTPPSGNSASGMLDRGTSTPSEMAGWLPLSASIPPNTIRCSPGKGEDAPSAAIPSGMEPDASSTSITATPPGEYAGSSVLPAISGSGSSATIRDCSTRPPCTCGHISGKRVLISKPVLFGYGLNLQCCSHMIFFVSHSWEQFFQAVRRCYRFGQAEVVRVDVVCTESEIGVLSNLKRKNDQAEAMFAELVDAMNDSLRIGRGEYGDREMEVPQWL